MSVEFRPDGTPIEIDDSFKAVTHKGPVRVVTNGKQAISILGPGRKRDRLLSEYLARQKPKPKIEAMVSEVKRAPAVVITPPPIALVADEDETAQEFLNAVAVDDQELYEPQEDEWFQARVLHTDVKRRYLLLELSTGTTVYCPWQKVTRSPGNHSVCLPVGTECTIRVKLDRGKYWALEMQTEGDEPYSVSRAQITVWRGMAGSAFRECGCPCIFVVCSREIDEATIHVGDWVEIIHRPSEKRGWAGIIKRKIEAPQMAQREE
jgi:hypothetical protein